MAEKCSYCGEKGHSIQQCPKWKANSQHPTKLLDDLRSLYYLIKERAHMVTILGTGLDIAYQLGKSVEISKAEGALKLLKLALDSAVITHKWDEAERWATKLREMYQKE